MKAAKSELKVLDLFLTRILSFAMSEGKTTVNCYLKREKTKKHDRTISRGSKRDWG